MTARINASTAQDRFYNLEQRKLSPLSMKDQCNIQYSLFAGWVPTISARTEAHWGLVCFRTEFNDDAGWQRCKNFFLEATQLAFWLVPESADIAKKWKIQFVEDDKAVLAGSSVEALSRCATNLRTTSACTD